VRLRASATDKNILSSLTKQFSENISLTDRQLELCLKKIQTYSKILIDTGSDVNHLLVNKPLRMPIRIIDRSKWLKIVKADDERQYILHLKFDYSKEFSAVWESIKEELKGRVFERSNFKEIPLHESNIFSLVPILKENGFDIDDQIMNIFEKINFISENPRDFLPYVDLDENKFVVKNANRQLVKYLEKISVNTSKKTDIGQLMTFKICGIQHKSTEAVERISNLSTCNTAKRILLSTESRFRANPEKYSIKDILNTINLLEIWPVLFIVDEDAQCLDHVKTIYESVQEFCLPAEMTVFFRMSNGQKNHHEFNQFIKDNHLNNYIDHTTKVVVISKNRIPKPLITSSWNPKTAVVMSAHDYGKISVYLNDFETVFYYNDSLQMRHSRTKGAKKIAEL